MKYLLILLMASSALADGGNVVVAKGQSCPFNGILLTPENAQTLDVQKYNLGSCTKISALKDDENSLLTQRVTNANDEVDRLSKQLAAKQDNSFWHDVAFFALGVGVTGLISYGLVKTLK